MFGLSVASMFKNESWIIVEWLEHYLKEGVEHFYLIDNGSTDDYISKIKPYMNFITLVKDNYRQPLGTQNILLNKHYLNIIKNNTKWNIIVDVDEYIYNRNQFKTISDYLKSVPNNINQIILPWKMFGNNNQKKQPTSIIDSFIKREDYVNYKKRINMHFVGHTKCITRTDTLVKLETHSSEIINPVKTFSNFELFNGDFKSYDIEKQIIHINHYTNLSLEYYTQIKIKRGGGQGGKYNLEKFGFENKIFNNTIDDELKNKKYITDTSSNIIS